MASTNKSPEGTDLDDILAGQHKIEIPKGLSEDPDFKKLTPKEQSLVAQMLYYPRKPWPQKCKDAGYSANSQPWVLRQQIKGKLSKTFTALGIYEDDLALLILDGIQAMKHDRFRMRKTDKDGATTDWIKTISEPDLAMRLKYGEFLALLGDMRPATKLDIKHGGKVEHDHNVNVSGSLENVSKAALEAHVMEAQKRRIEEAKEAEFEIIEEKKKRRPKREIREAV